MKLIRGVFRTVFSLVALTASVSLGSVFVYGLADREPSSTEMGIAEAATIFVLCCIFLVCCISLAWDSLKPLFGIIRQSHSDSKHSEHWGITGWVLAIVFGGGGALITGLVAEHDATRSFANTAKVVRPAPEEICETPQTVDADSAALLRPNYPKGTWSNPEGGNRLVVTVGEGITVRLDDCHNFSDFFVAREVNARHERERHMMVGNICAHYTAGRKNTSKLLCWEQQVVNGIFTAANLIEYDTRMAFTRLTSGRVTQTSVIKRNLPDFVCPDAVEVPAEIQDVIDFEAFRGVWQSTESDALLFVSTDEGPSVTLNNCYPFVGFEYADPNEMRPHDLRSAMDGNVCGWLLSNFVHGSWSACFEQDRAGRPVTIHFLNPVIGPFDLQMTRVSEPSRAEEPLVRTYPRHP